MTLPDLLTACEALGVTLDVRLAIDAPPGVLTEDLRAALVEQKWALAARIARDRHWQELAALRWGPAIGDDAPGLDVRPGESLA